MKKVSDVLATLPPEVLARYDFSAAVYKGALAPIENIRCPVHGVFQQYSGYLRRAPCGCPACGAEMRRSKRATPQEDFVAKASQVHGGRYDYTHTVFTKYNAKIKVGCPVHGLFEVTANHHYYRKHGCPQCEAEAKKTRIVKYRHLSHQAKVENTAVDFFARCTAAHEGVYTYPEQSYLGAKHKIRVLCATHGEFEQAAWKHLNGSGCPKCGAYDPVWETEVSVYLESLGETPVRSAPVLAGRQVDVYLPARNFGIELHGLYWHSEQFRSATYHAEKWQAAERAGIRLLQVFEDEWRDKKEAVKARIAAMLGKGVTFDARKCAVSVLTPAAAHGLLAHVHTQGEGRASHYYGLLFEGRVVAVASFGRVRSGAMVKDTSSDAWEVIRYASEGRVRGGFTRLFKRFLQDVAPTRVVSYCDLRYGDGRLYKAAGFTLDAVTEPDYWWVPPGRVTRIPRYRTQKHKLASDPVFAAVYSPTKTEVEICHKAGWLRVYGVGHQRWVWTAPQ